MPEVVSFLGSLGWTREVDYGGELWFAEPCRERAIELFPTAWALCRCVNGDIEIDEEGDTIEELKAALEAVSA